MSPDVDGLLSHASEKVRDRALRLQGSVQARTRAGDTLRARVQGSERAPYRVAADLGRGTWACSCPDDLNAMCKHVCAALLVWRASPESFAAAPAACRGSRAGPTRTWRPCWSACWNTTPPWCATGRAW